MCDMSGVYRGNKTVSRWHHWSGNKVQTSQTPGLLYFRQKKKKISTGMSPLCKARRASFGFSAVHLVSSTCMLRLFHTASR